MPMRYHLIWQSDNSVGTRSRAVTCTIAARAETLAAARGSLPSKRARCRTRAKTMNINPLDRTEQRLTEQSKRRMIFYNRSLCRGWLSCSASVLIPPGGAILNSNKLTLEHSLAVTEVTRSTAILSEAVQLISKQTLAAIRHGAEGLHVTLCLVTERSSSSSV
jgi:hypothetical protein